jgi:GT2 family glycosyltransferase
MSRDSAIVILNYKGYQDTINCIESFFKFHDNKQYVVVIVDNASNNDSLAKISTHFCLQKNIIVEKYIEGNTISPTVDILLVQNDFNYGYAHGNNVGLKLVYGLGSKYLMVLNNDTLFIEESLLKLQKIVEQDSAVLCAGPMLLKADKISIDYNCAKRRPTYIDIFRLSYFGRWLKTIAWENEYYYSKKEINLKQSMVVDIISGSCMFFNAKKFNELGFFDENTFLYYEEAIVAEKARKKGYKMILEPNAKVIHLGAQTTKNQSTSLFTLNCEYNSLKLYLKEYRKVSSLKLSILLLSSLLFIKLYSIKNSQK